VKNFGHSDLASAVVIGMDMGVDDDIIQSHPQKNGIEKMTVPTPEKEGYK
jgi:hypothetical protein